MKRPEADRRNGPKRIASPWKSGAIPRLDKTSEITLIGRFGIDATKKIPGEGFKRPWPPLIKMDESVRKRIDAMFNR